MRKGVLTSLWLFFLIQTQPVLASDFGCKVLLCMANPKGPMALKECKPTIKKLYRNLYKGKSFPNCAFQSPPGNTMSFKKGKQSYYPCGTGYEKFNRGGRINRTVCRKVIDTKIVSTRAGRKEIPIYDEYNAKRRSEPYWMQLTTVTPNGQIQGQRFWYKKKKKKRLF